MQNVKMLNAILKSQWLILRSHRLLMLLIVFLAIVSSILSLVFARVNQEIIDNVFIDLDFEYLLSLIPFVIITFIFTMLVETTSSYADAKLRTLHSITAQRSFYKEMLRTSYKFLSSVLPNDIYYRMFVDMSVITSFAYSVFLSIPISLITVIILFSVILMWSWPLATFISISIILQIIIVKKISVPLKKATEKYRVDEQKIATFISESFGIVDIIKAYAIEKWQNKRIDINLEYLRGSKLKTQFLSVLFSALTSIVHTFWSLGALIFGAWLATRGDISVGAYFGIYMIANRIFGPMQQLFNQTLTFQQAKVSYARVEEYCDNCEEKEYSGDKPFSLKKNIALKNITFGYNNFPVHNNSDFTFYAGKTYAITGKSGVGKTTLIKLLGRLFFPSEGRVFVDEIDINDIDHKDVKKNIAYMPQQAIVFEASLKENISLGENFSEDEIIESMKTVGMSDFVESLEAGVNANIGIKNRNMSEGEKQRICLARALIRNPKLLLLDEPTSHLDDMNTKVILDCLYHYKQKNNATIIMVTHNANCEFIDEWIKL